MSQPFDAEAIRALEHARWERAAPRFAPAFATATGQFAEALLDAGFTTLNAQIERRVWRHRDAASLVAALRAGTARMAALIDAQSPTAQRAIVAAIDASAAAWRDADGLALPIVAVIAAGVKH